MLLTEIENLRDKLNKLITDNESYDKIYKMSIQLDLLINEYYCAVRMTA